VAIPCSTDRIDPVQSGLVAGLTIPEAFLARADAVIE
jgi:hypothetical protein